MSSNRSKNDNSLIHVKGDRQGSFVSKKSVNNSARAKIAEGQIMKSLENVETLMGKNLISPRQTTYVSVPSKQLKLTNKLQ